VFHLAVALVAIALPLQPLLGQEFRGSITGQAIDSTGSVVPNVKVSAKNTATNVSTSTVTNAAGNYTILYLMPGIYDVTAESAGFKTLERRSIEVRVGDKLDIDLKLELASVESSIVVTTGSTPLLDTQSASIGAVVDRRSISELPLVDGNPFTLTNLAAGVVFTGNDMASIRPFDNGTTSGVRADGAPGGNEFSLDGAPNTGVLRGVQQGSNVGFIPPAEAVEEFKMETASFDAQHGHASGTNVNVSLKSGTNALHGAAYEFYRPASLAANDFFLKRVGQEPSSFLYHRFGGTVGGPVFLPKLYDGRNRTFFFFAYENMMLEQPSPKTVTIPTLPERAGDFSALLSQGMVMYDPLSARSAANGRIQRSAFPGNIILRDRISPIASKVLTYYPEPNLPGDAQGALNLICDNRKDNVFNSETIRLDHVLTVKHRFFIRLYRNLRLESAPRFTGEINGIRPANSVLTRGNGGINYDHVFMASASGVINVRVGVSRYTDGHEQVAPGFSPASLGFPASTVALFQGAAYFPRFGLSSYESLGAAAGDFLAHKIVFLQPTYVRISGRHSLHMGYDLRAYREDAVPQNSPAGQYSFSSTYTRGPLDNSPAAAIGQDLASMLVGLPSGGLTDRNATRDNQVLYQGLFVQDDFKISSKLTLNLGLRYEHEAPPTERYNRNIRGFDRTSPNPIEAAARAAYSANRDPSGLTPDAFHVLGGLLFADSNHRSFWDTGAGVIQPRFGLAYQVAPKTVLRGGWGLYMIPYVVGGVQQAGFSQVTNIVPTLDGGLTFVANLANPFPSGVLNPLGASGGLATYLGQSISSTPIDRQTGKTQRWQIGMQRQLPGQWVVEASYAGTRGYDMVVPFNLNALPRQYLSTSPVRDQKTIDLLSAKVTNPFNNLVTASTSLGGSTVARSQLLLPFPQFTSVSSERYGGSTRYQGIQFRAERRFRRGFTLNIAYAYSRLRESLTLLNASDSSPVDRVSPDDRPHRLAMSGIWELPFGKGRKWGGSWNRLVEGVLGGWQLNGVYLAQSGMPFALSSDLYFSGDPNSLVATYEKQNIGAPAFDVSGFYFHDSAVQTNGVDDPAKQRNDQRIKLESHVRTLPSILPNFRGDRILNLDLSLIKTLRINERFKVQVRGEALNANNRVQLREPGLSPTAASFGMITQLRNVPRQLQFGVKLLF
jgi:hypothetical protein